MVDKSQIKLILGVTNDMLPKVEQLASKINAINKSRRDELSSLNPTLEGPCDPCLGP